MVSDMDRLRFRAWVDGEMFDMVDLLCAESGLIESVKVGFLNNPYWGKRTKSIESVDLIQCTGLRDKNGVLIYDDDIVYVAGYGNYLVPMFGGNHL